MRALTQSANLTPTAELHQLTCPTLFVVGIEDPIVPPAAMHELSAMVVGSEVVVVEQATHSAYFENAGRVQPAGSRVPRPSRDTRLTL